MTQDFLQDFRKRLLHWYRANKRDLPWRKTRDPYRILVSEIMLQQTRAETVVPYYERFLSRFPDPQSLATTETAEVLKQWQGLGYYRRARYLQDAARAILRVHDGQVPRSADLLQRLPGVGAYTAAAVASIAYQEPVAVVDGNVTRVLARVFRLSSPVGSAALKRAVRELAEQVLDSENPGDFNQAMMELGATICTPQSPSCGKCPVLSLCQAASANQQEQFPVPGERKPVPEVEVAIGLVWRGEQLLLSKRFDDAMLGGMWELPGGKIEPGETPAQCVERELAEEVGLRVTAQKPVTTVRHAYSHFRVILHAFKCQLVAGEAKPVGCADVAWVRSDELGNYPVPTATVKVFEAVGILPQRKAAPRSQPG